MMKKMNNQMTDKEVLEAAFKAVKDNGWNGDIPIYDESMGQWYVSDDDGGYIVPSITEILLSHEFCKALWGDVDPTWNSNLGIAMPAGAVKYWQYHLQQLALAEDRIDYLRKNA